MPGRDREKPPSRRSGEALLVYANLQEVLREELGVSPCATTQAVYHQLLRA
jgi:DNA-binding SARP family transcriptional activator